MIQESLFAHWKKMLEDQLLVLPDKSEENADNTLRALWLLASGEKLSAHLAGKRELPELTNDQIGFLENIINQRLNGIPLAHLTGRQNFMGVELLSDKRALIPRKETEILGKTALEICKRLTEKKTDIKIMDVCCGSGNLGIALASMISEAKVFSSDLSDEAVELTQENINFLNLNERVKVTKSDLFGSFDSEEFFGQIDLIVCNPPYISTSKVLRMNPEIAENEPPMAFDGGMVGLKVIQSLIRESPKFLKRSGCVVFEVGLGQGPFVIQLCEKSNKYDTINSFTDISGNIRVIAASLANY